MRACKLASARSRDRRWCQGHPLRDCFRDHGARRLLNEQQRLSGGVDGMDVGGKVVLRVGGSDGSRIDEHIMCVDGSARAE